MLALVTRLTLEEKLAAYLNRSLPLSGLVDWAETAIMDGEFDEADAELLTDIVARLGVADVRDFGLTWEDCSALMERLGFKVQVLVTAA